ncbi:VOC family protein [Liquorilactobacillus vini]|uniref:Catechol-2,3-dioxygenase subunit n=1 Tax=Liquorilactobacillus vini DSM 20605 TaxID=1133569 RepID=A0A0R2CB26_9LACO|nr:VOC family protein [Liquorilactobacillus vini]KRM89005.1 catechol-2,3-dioxygenase subunit [Liquorilactobacillus vini DSM 20605]
MTVIIPDFQLAAATQPGTVALKVADLNAQTSFYRDIIGLDVYEQGLTRSILGAHGSQKPLLILQQIMSPLPLTRKTGLYHTAFLLPSRKDLGNALIHYLNVQAPIIGASDHGYSEAIYLTDPEGNGIEVYRDKPRSAWDIRPDGEIPGITIEMDAQGVVAAADQNWQGFPAATKIGHVHLKVADLAATEEFYTDVLGLSLKTNFGNSAKFFASGGYHHHLGTNIWNGRNLPAMDQHDLGLAYYSFFTPDEVELARVRENLEKLGQNFEILKDQSLALTDPNGIKLRFEIVPES